jgi:hypothetical protein
VLSQYGYRIRNNWILSFAWRTYDFKPLNRDNIWYWRAKDWKKEELYPIFKSLKNTW